MTLSKPLLKVVSPVREYLDGKLAAPQLVRIIDDLVSENLMAELEPVTASLVDKLHIALALYTPDADARREEPRALIGPVELLEHAREFDREARLLGY